jgi:hypothetical protein
MSSHQLFFFLSTKNNFSLHTSAEGEFFFFPLKSDYKTQMHVSVDDFHPCSMVVVEK